MTLCQETTGFLFSHACGRPATQACAQCAKQVCPQHCRTAANGVLCLTCARTMLATPGTSTVVFIDDDPYFYRSHYYGHYHWHHHEGLHSTSPPPPGPDPADFTEGDRGALSGGGDFGDADDQNFGGGGDFGDDMGAS